MKSVRCALVMGNAAYSGALSLSSPRHDAQHVADALGALQFDVSVGIDLRHDDMEILFTSFISKLDVVQPDVTIFYYSGHGLQIERRNFVVPIDFDRADALQLFSVQDLIDKISKRTSIQIVMLDACRSGLDGDRIFDGEALILDGKKRVRFESAGITLSGLAEMRAPPNTFIAFAAAPGDFAYDGDMLLSPFTDAFLRYVDAVDLPLSNLMSRVRQDVYKATNQRQVTWDHSSLTFPFYFNPGSMFLLSGNALALFGVVVSLIPYSLLLASPEKSWGWILVAGVFPTLSLIILLTAAHRLYARLRGSFRLGAEVEYSVREYLLLSIEKGALGGYFGSLVASLGIAYVYYDEWLAKFNVWISDLIVGRPTPSVTPPEPLGKMVVELAIATALTACIVGVLSIFFARATISRGRITIPRYVSPIRNMLGAAFGGVIAGLVCGPILMCYYGSLSRPDAMPTLLVPPGIVGAVIVVFSIVNFDFERLTSRRLLLGLSSALGAVLIGAVIAATIFGVLYLLGIVDAVVAWLSDNSQSNIILAVGGAIYGVPVGLSLGIVIGAAIALTGRLTGKPVLSKVVEQL